MAILSLYRRCLLAVRNAIEDGLIANLDHLPPVFRKDIFSCIVMHRSIENAGCLKVIDRDAFLKGFSEIGLIDDLDSDDRPLINVILQNIAKDPSIADSITSLSLRIKTTFDDEELGTNFGHLCQLIDKCKNLKSLTLLGERANGRVPECDPFKLLTETITSDQNATKLEELSLKCFGYKEQFGEFSGRLFDNLQSLRLESVEMNAETFRNLLSSCRSSLRALKLSKFTTSDESIIQVDLPELQSLYIDRHDSKLPLSEADLSRLAAGSPQLGEICVHVLDTEENFVLLNRLSAMNLTSFEIELDVRGDPTLTKLLKNFAKNIVKLRVRTLADLPHEVLEPAISGSSNLISLDMVSASGACQIAEKFLNAILNDESRALKLHDLALRIRTSPDTFQRLFSRCRNLDSLRLEVDDYALEPTSFDQLPDNGALPSSIVIIDIENITDNTLLPLLRHCGCNLKSISIGFAAEPPQDLTKSVFDRTAEFCPMVESVYYDKLDDEDEISALKEKYKRQLFRVPNLR